MAAKKGGRPRPGPPPKGQPAKAPAPKAGTSKGAQGAGKAQPVRTPAGRPVVAPGKVMLATAPLLARVGTLPKALLPVVTAILVLVGLALGGPVGLVCLLVVATFLGWLLAAFWPITPGPGRVLRTLAIVALVAVGVLQAF
jgi:hypothetical protein